MNSYNENDIIEVRYTLVKVKKEMKKENEGEDDKGRVTGGSRVIYGR